MSLSTTPQQLYSPNILSPVVPPYGMLDDFLGMDSGFAGLAWFTNNSAVFCPIYVPEPFTAVQAFVNNGSAVSGTWDIGLYNESGSRQWSLSSLAAPGAAVTQSGTATIQLSDMTDTVIPRGRWLLAFSASSTGAQYIRMNPAAEILRLNGCFEVASSHPLPSSVTLANPSNGYTPVFGLTSLSGGI